MEIANIAGYKFVSLDDAEVLQTSIRRRCNELGLKGTVLLSTEGINLNLAGFSYAISDFICKLYEDSRFADIVFKKSVSSCQPFHRLKVKLKPEIIRMNAPNICSDTRAPTVAPHELKQWLDEKREVVLLDARNEFEVRSGTFRDAISLRLNTFSEFPQAAAALKDEIKSKTIVTFCTGGIRCEKAALYLRHQGYPEVYQLDGGILNYFEQCGSAHYQGECFVFDERVSLNHELREPKKSYENFRSELTSTEAKPDNPSSGEGPAHLSPHTNAENQSQ